MANLQIKVKKMQRSKSHSFPGCIFRIEKMAKSILLISVGRPKG